MRIVRVEAGVATFRMAEPYAIAGAVFDEAPNVFVRIVTDGAEVGLAAFSPEPLVTGETAHETCKALRAVAPLLEGIDPWRRVHVREILRAELPDRPAVRALVDTALYDHLARVSGLALWRILGGYRDRMMTSVTLGIGPVDEVVRQARERVDQGFRALKLKGGEDHRADADRVLAVRAEVGPAIELRFDANQGYTVEEAVTFVSAVESAGLELIEQPSPSHHAMGAVTRRVPIPVMADESVRGLEDVWHLTKAGMVDMVNVKLVKVGGLGDAMHIDSVARASGCQTMVGCMDDCGFGIAASLAFALARGNVHYADLDGHLDLLEDPTAGVVRLEAGELVPSDAPGLGMGADLLERCGAC